MPSRRSGGAGGLRSPDLLTQLGWLLLLVAALLLGRASRVDDSQVAVVWPAAAVNVVWLLSATGLSARARTVAVMAATVGGVQLATGLEPLACVLFAGVNVVHAVVAVTVVERWGGWRGVRTLGTTRDGLVLGAGAVVAGLVSGSLGGAVAAWRLDAELALGTGQLVVRNAVSTVVMGALLLAAPRLRQSWRERRTGDLEVLFFAVSLVLAHVLAFQAGSDLPLAFLVLPFWVWAGARLGPSLAALLVALSAIPVVRFAVAGEGLLSGPFSVTERVIVGQVYLSVTALVALGLALGTAERDAALRSARQSTQRLRRYLDSSLVGFGVVELAGPAVLRSGNAALASFLGRDLADVEGLTWSSVVAPADQGAVRTALAQVREGGHWHGEVEHLLPDGASRWALVSLSALTGADAEHQAAAQFLDVTERRAAAQQLAHRALHDELTGLPSRTLLRERLESALTASRLAEGPATTVALLFLDLDHFKSINDSWGHRAGDQVLAAVAQRLMSALRPGDTVARVGGDEFVVLCPQVQGEDEVRLIAGRLLQATREPILLDGRDLAITVSVGMALADAGDVAASLLQRSDHAMLSAKRQGRGISVLAGPEHEAVDGDAVAAHLPVQDGPVRASPVH